MFRFFLPISLCPAFLIICCCCSVAKSCMTLGTHNYSMPGFPVLHHLPELAQTHVESVMPSSHLILCHLLLLLPSNLSEHQGLFQWVSSSHQVAKVLELVSASVLPMNIQDWFPLGLTGWISLQSRGLSRVFSNTTVQKHQFFGPQLSSQSNSHIHTWLLGKP